MPVWAAKGFSAKPLLN